MEQTGYNMQIYIVQAQDTIDRIAARYGVAPQQIAWINQLVYPYPLAIGQALLISTGEEEEERLLSSSGYAYPFISRWVLEQTLPFLTELRVFSYGFTAEGALVYPQPSDDWMTALAWQNQTAPVMTLAPMNEAGYFDNTLIGVLVNSDAIKARLFSELLEVLSDKGYTGVDIDFEYIRAEDSDAFQVFFAELAMLLRGEGYTISIALAPKTSDDQPGLLYEGKDYRILGEIADSVLLMTYEWGYKYGPNMAVAPLNQVRRVVEYALTRIPAEKIDLGIPNYGYDWPLPFERGVTQATTIGNVEAIQIALKYGAVIEFDETAQSPFFRYVDNGIQHEVWFEDVRSISAKFALIQELSLRGCGYWQLMRWWRANWVLLDSTFIIQKG